MLRMLSLEVPALDEEDHVDHFGLSVPAVGRGARIKSQRVLTTLLDGSGVVPVECRDLAQCLWSERRDAEARLVVGVERWDAAHSSQQQLGHGDVRGTYVESRAQLVAEAQQSPDRILGYIRRRRESTA